ncbi:MAG: ABC-F family ATP-binding cassette domain-containing protein [Muribaculaceae bacterium]
MISYLQIENLTKSYGDRMLFADVTFGINEGDKVGLIAKNGTGKTTLLSIIAGKEDYDSGRIVFNNDIRVGYLEQVPSFQSSKSVIDTCIEGNEPLAIAVRNYEHALHNGNSDAMTAAIQEMDNCKAWDYEDRFKQILSMLKITDINQPIEQLSGGQIKRVALAKILINEPNLLILDEPTNHLDIDMIEWLENYLSRNRMAILMVTHDRYFLDKVCNKIVEIDNEKVYSYNGKYNYFLEKRIERLDAQNAELARAKNLYRTELEWIRRQPQARGSKARYRINAFHELQDKVSTKVNNKTLDINIKSSYIGSKIFVAHNVSKSFGENVIVKDFSYIFARYEKLGIVGNNGAGKSSFIKLLLNEYQPDNGFFEIGETVRFGYYSQEGITFNESKKVIDSVREIAEHIHFDEKTSYSASQFLNLFLFSAKDQQKLISKLSGGEKRRLYLATVLMRQPNFLILDEPTNDLDIVTLEVLEDYISKFKGCVIIISHDRFFMDRTVDHIFVFEGNGVIKDFPGNYSEYREWKQENDKLKDADKPKEQQKAKASNAEKNRNSNKLTFKERKEFEELTKELDSLNNEKQEIETVFSIGSNTADLDRLAKRYNELKSIIDEKEYRWLELSEKE